MRGGEGSVPNQVLTGTRVPMSTEINNTNAEILQRKVRASMTGEEGLSTLVY